MKSKKPAPIVRASAAGAVLNGLPAAGGVMRGLDSFANLAALHFTPVGVLVWICAGLAGAPSLKAQEEYTADGNPTALEEEIRWHTNRARSDTARENLLRGTAYADVPAFSGPLAPHDSLSRAARRHSEDMAKRNAFQHETIAGSAYYNSKTQPSPWDRFEAEGYTSWNSAGENISAGYASAESAYLGWWNSTGHRTNMCDPEMREIGNGYFFWAASTYDRYYTMDLGASRAGLFFTDTLFTDTNADGSYDQGEGVGGVRITLRLPNADHTAFDLSTTAGSFAIPIATIDQGLKIEVWLTNQNAGSVQLSIPRTYSTNEKLTLAPSESRWVGSVFQGNSGNLGFRQLTAAPPPILPPVLSLNRLGNHCLLSWPSLTGLQYLPQWTSDLKTWSDLDTGFQNGNGGIMTKSDTEAGAASVRFYRLLIRRP